MPRGVAVKVVDGDGDVRAEGFKETLGIRTSDGSVRVTNSSRALDLSTADGSIHALGIDSRHRARPEPAFDGSVQLKLVKSYPTWSRPAARTVRSPSGCPTTRTG